MKVLNEEFKKEITAADYKAATIDAAMDFEMRTIKIYSSRAKQLDEPHEEELYRIHAGCRKGHHELLERINDEVKSTNIEL